MYKVVNPYIKRKKKFENFEKNNIRIIMHSGFNNQFIQAMRTRPIFQKFKKIFLFSFSIWDYEFIRKTYS